MNLYSDSKWGIFDFMKFLVFIFAFIGFSNTAFSQSAATKKKINDAQVMGDWQLVDYQYGPQAKKKKPLTTCDTTLKWSFSQDAQTKKYMLKCVSIEGCEDFGFESDWVLSGSNLMIKRTKILGFGGISASGTFIIKELTANRMVLEFQKNRYIFKK